MGWFVNLKANEVIDPRTGRVHRAEHVSDEARGPFDTKEEAEAQETAWREDNAELLAGIAQLEQELGFEKPTLEFVYWEE